MNLKDRIDQDLKQSMLEGDELRVSTLRSIKSAILYEEVAKAMKEKGLDEEAIQNVLAREAKKRQESADLYKKGGREEKAQKELEEKTLIESYLPKKASVNEIETTVDEVIKLTGAKSVADIGKVIGGVRSKLGQTADGTTIAEITKNKLQ